jgi:hypothetical protein
MILKKLGNKNLTILVVALLIYALTLRVHLSFEKPLIKISQQDSSLNFNQDFLRIFSVGNKKLIADMLWVQTLLQSDLEHYKKSNLENWMFHRFMAISVLDEKFYENYFYGSLYLSIVKDDPLAASVLYERGLVYYPEDFNLNYNAGFNYYFELGEYSKGLVLLDKIKNHPKASKILLSVVNKLKLQTGVDINTVYNLVLERIKQSKDPELESKLREEAYSLKAEMDLDCLNNGKAHCDTKDFVGIYYVKRADKKYYTSRPFNLYRLKKKRGQN